MWVKWALGSITMNKARGGDGIPVGLLQILKGDAMKVLHLVCQQIWKTQQWSQDWKRSVFIPIPKKSNAKEWSIYCTIALISHTRKVTLKIRPPQQFVHPDCPLQEAIFFLLVAAVRETTVWPRVVKTNCHVNLLVRAPAARASSNNKFLKGCLLNVIRVYSFFVQMLNLYFQGRSDISLISYFCRKILFYVVDVSLRQFHSLHILKWLSLFLNSKQKNKVFVDYSNFLYTF